MRNDNYNPNEESSLSQNEKILEYLKKGKRITALVALEEFQCFRLASRISDLMNGTWKGSRVPIKDRYIVVPYSQKRVKEYYIDDDDLAKE